jgi:hypothetical protein
VEQMTKGASSRHGTLDVSIGMSVWRELLSTDLYKDLPDALFELIKNGLDSAVRKLRTPGVKPFDPEVQIHLVANHPLAPGGITLIGLDNGEGLTPATRPRFLKTGYDGQASTHGLFDRKRVGRYAGIACVQDKDSGFWFAHADTRRGEVEVIQISPVGLSNKKLDFDFVDRDASILHGLAPREGSFGMFILPNVAKKLTDAGKLEEALKWFLPRRDGDYSCILRINDKKVVVPPLAADLVVTADGLEGFFRKDDNRKPEGIRICDAGTGIMVAKATQMAKYLPYPMAWPAITGDIFIPDLIKYQTTDRSGLSSDYLDSDKWRDHQLVLLDHFSPKLIEVLGEVGLSRKDYVNKALTKAVSLLTEHFGKPKTKQKPPRGINPGNGGGGEGTGGKDGSGSGGSGRSGTRGGSGTGGKGGSGVGGKGEKKPSIEILYKGKVYFVDLGPLEQNRRSQVASGNLVWINSRDPMHKILRGSPPALSLYILEGIVTAIELTEPDNQVDSDNYQLEAQKALRGIFTKGK